MTQTYTENVIIDGALDETQLTVQGNGPQGTEQGSPLQSWETSDAQPQARVTGDGRVQVGTFSAGVMATDESLLEAHRHEDDTAKPKRGLHLLGGMKDALNTVVSWVAQELVLKGTGGISALHTALRVRLTNENTGDMTGADLRGGDIEVSNAGGNIGGNGKVPEATALRLTVTNQAAGYLDTAYGLKVEMANSGSRDNAYAIHTGEGLVHLGDVMEIAEQSAAPAGEVGVMRIYPKTDGKLYARNPAGTEFDLTGVGAANLGDLNDVNAPTPANGDVLTYDGALSQWIPSTGGSTYGIRKDEIAETVVIAADEQAIWGDQIGLVDGTGVIQVDNGGAFFIIH